MNSRNILAPIFTDSHFLIPLVVFLFGVTLLVAMH